MLGIILCGGNSSRMGSDKGLLKLEAKTWAQTAIDKITPLGIPVKLSVNQQQYKDYTAVFDAADLVVDAPSLDLRGPLLGVLSCHLQYPQRALFALACDMPLMESTLLKELHERYQQAPEAEACVFTNDGEPEPLCAIYSARGLAKILALLQNGHLVKHSMKYMLDHLSIVSIPIQPQQKISFRNFNAHAELNGL